MFDLERFGRQVNGLQTTLMLATLRRHLPLYVVNEFPKSGGTWISQMLADAIGVPFPRHRMLPFQSCVVHGHYYRNFAGGPTTLVVWRDGRDVMVSFYYQCYFSRDPISRPIVLYMRQALPFPDYDDIQANLPVFIERSMTNQIWPKFSWADFVRQWRDRPVTTYVRYEDLRHAPVEELQRLVSALTGRALPANRAQQIVERYSFERQARRPAGTVDNASFHRKGIVGDWRNHFTQEAEEIFLHHAGAQLRLLGYY